LSKDVYATIRAGDSYSLSVPALGQPLINPDSNFDSILDALHARGQDLKDFSSDVVLHTIDERTGRIRRRSARLPSRTAKNGDSRIRVSFELNGLMKGNGTRRRKNRKLD